MENKYKNQPKTNFNPADFEDRIDGAFEQKFGNLRDPEQDSEKKTLEEQKETEDSQIQERPDAQKIPLV